MDAAHDAIHPAQRAAERAAPQVRPAAPPPALDHALANLWSELQGLIHEHLLLASLESRRAAMGLLRLVVLAVVGATLLFGAWAVCMTAVLLWLLEAGWTLPLALIVVAGGSLAVAAGSFWVARVVIREIAFPATLRRLANAPLPEEPT